MAKLTEMSPIMGKSYLELFYEKQAWDCTKQDINQLIAKIVKADTEKKSTDTTGQYNTLDALKDTDILKVNTREVEKHLKTAKDNHDYCAEQLINLEASMQTKLTDMSRYIKEIEELEVKLGALEKGSYDKELYTRIQEVVDKGDYIFLGKGDEERIPMYSKNESTSQGNYRLSSNLIYFLSKNPIICTHNNVAAGIAKSIDFGHILVGITKSGEIGVCRFAINYIKNCGIQHPHLSSDSLCWGNSSASLKKIRLATNPDLSAILSLVKQLLETYCPDYPYAKLASFATKQRHLCSLPKSMLLKIPRRTLDTTLEKAIRWNTLSEEYKQRLDKETKNPVYEAQLYSDEELDRVADKCKKACNDSFRRLISEKFGHSEDSTVSIITIAKYIESKGIKLLTKEEVNCLPLRYKSIFAITRLYTRLTGFDASKARDLYFYILISSVMANRRLKITYGDRSEKFTLTPDMCLSYKDGSLD